MIIIGGILIIVYLIAIGMLIYGYQNISEFDFNTSKETVSPKTRFSIIIPFRNEAENLPVLLESIKNLNYPENLYEIIFVDDESEDDSVKIIENLIKPFNLASTTLSDLKVQFKIINNNRSSASPKKDAITEAISISEYDWILTTDADCKLPKDWLLAFDSYIQQHQPTMLVGPVKYFSEKGLINQYQQLDNFSLQTATVGLFGIQSPLLCNGANLAYKKEEFKAVSGFLGNNHIASGDDIFLLEKFRKRNPKRVQFIKSRDAIVITRPQNSWKSIINQRIRWASKTSKQKDIYTKLLGVIVFLSNLFVLSGLALCFLNTVFIFYFITFLAVKIIIDYTVLCQTSTFFGSKINVPYFLLNTLIYPIITVVVVAKALKGNYYWKGRIINSK